jgi:hypothetical protein
MKYNFVSLIALVLSIPLIGCQLILENNSNKLLLVTDLDAHHKQLVMPGSKINANQNPDTHAHLRIIFNPKTNEQKIYRLDQIACSKTHEIPITAHEILSNAVNRSLLSLKEE